MAHTLGMGIFAEGVETAEQAAKLTQMNAESMQGYLFSKPLPFDELKDLLERQVTLSQVLP